MSERTQNADGVKRARFRPARRSIRRRRERSGHNRTARHEPEREAGGPPNRVSCRSVPRTDLWREQADRQDSRAWNILHCGSAALVGNRDARLMQSAEGLAPPAAFGLAGTTSTAWTEPVPPLRVASRGDRLKTYNPRRFPPACRRMRAGSRRCSQ